tara:strand:- start:2088 stop:2387 length:300 start_codon:yes stop_codon:yes gene_type:complete
MNLQQEKNNDDKLTQEVNKMKKKFDPDNSIDKKLTVDEMINRIRSYVSEIEAHMDEGGQISSTNGYDMVNQIKLLLKLNDVNTKHWNNLKEKMEGVKND